MMSKKTMLGYKHEWIWDWPWHMVDLRDWFYMVNVGEFGDMFLHVRVLGLRSLWTFSPPNKRNWGPSPIEACMDVLIKTKLYEDRNSDSAETDVPAVIHVETQDDACDCPLCTYTPAKTEAS
jgi:hypothetical protein